MSLTDQLGFSFKPPDRRVWTVRDLVAAVRTHIEREYGDTWVEGEISNFRAPGSGHLYFTLKDEGAQISVVTFRSQARLLRFRPENGMQIVARGRVTIYEDRGELQIAAEYLEPKEEAGTHAAKPHRDCDLSSGSGFTRHPEHSAPAASHGQCAHLSRASAG
jgi:exodeoxyribonuclease VII large subunit